jgi:uncharacterized RDD family membrane protein YckC
LASNSSSSPETPPRIEYVGFWKRFVAVVIDTLILLIVIVPALIAIYGREYLARAQDSAFAGFWDFLLQVVLPAVAVILFWRYRGATPGKMAISARIVDAQTGGRPATGKLVLRYFAYLASTLPLLLGFVWIAIDRRKQGFHDKIANTLVIYDDD